MEIRGRVQNGVVVVADGTNLPEGAEVIVVYSATVTPEAGETRERITLPLVRCQTPGSIHLTGPMIGEILDAEDLAPGH